MAIHRNRVIYQSEALFISPDATGYHFTGAETNVPNVGSGPFGLMTPPINDRQDFGGTLGEPALNSAGQLVGWQPGDTWPKWNPDNNMPARKAFFDGNADIDDHVEDYSLVATVAGSAGNVNILAVDVDGNLNIDGNTSISNIAANNGFTFAGDNTGDTTLKPDAGTSITIDGGQDEVQAFVEFRGIRIESTLPGLDGNGKRIDVQDGFADPNGMFVEMAGLTPIIQIGANLNPTLQEIVDLFNNTADTDMVASLVDAAGDTFVKTTDNFATSGGQNEITAAATLSIPVESKQLPVHIVAEFEGSAGNVTLTGRVENDLELSVEALVGEHNNANPDNKLIILEGGAHILNAGAKIKVEGGSDGYAHAHGSIIKQLKRVQSANYGFTVNRADVNQFGHASRLDSIVVESPTVNLDFSYYILDGFNERMLEFVTNGSTNTLSGLLTPELYQAGNNFFILTTPEARDAVRGDVNLNESESLENSKSVISLGNGYVTDYSVDISVGSIPTANVTVEGMNIKSDFGTTGNNLPSVDMRDGSAISHAWSGNQKGVSYEGGCTGLFSLPAASSGYSGCTGDTPDVAALRPGDVVLDLANAGLISKNVSGNANVPVVGSAHVQSVSIQLPLARTTLQRLGSTFGFSKSIDLPLNVSFNVNAMVADMKEGNMLDLLCDCEKLDVGVTVFDPDCNVCETKQGTVAMKYELKGARLESENFSSSIGDNKSVDLTFTAQIGGADDLANGLFISGKEANEDNKGLPPAWTGVGGQTTGAASGYLFGYRG